MNSIVCLETITAFLFGFCLICAESTIARGPNDTSVILGGTVKLECFTEDKNYPPRWSYEKVGSGDEKDISLVLKVGDLIVPKLLDGYVERHSIVGDRNTGEYSLRITDIKPEDAGTYTCTARGGLTEKRSAELSVFEPYPVCACNITDVVGENECHMEPDVIELSCKFRVYGNYLPKITWTDVSHPEKVIIINTPKTNATGMVSSKLIIKGNYVGLDTTRFRCMVASTENADDNRFTCVTPKINVLKITNLTESKTLVAPEEVVCTGWSKLNASGCEWLRREDDDNGHQHETHVTSQPLLNLHLGGMKQGTYICVANCSIRGETCRVKLLDVSYNPPANVLPRPEQSNIAYVVPVIVVIAIISTAGLFICFRKRRKNRHRPIPDLPVSSDSRLQNQQGAPLLYSNLSSTETPVVESANGLPSQQETSHLADTDGTLLAEERALARMRKSPKNSARLSGENIPLIVEPENDDSVFVDSSDAKLGGIKNNDGARLAVEKPLARTRKSPKNSARLSGESSPLISPDDDVAEGVSADKEKHE